MPLKSFINARQTVVTDAIDGFLMSSGARNLARLDAFPDIKVVLRSDWDKSRVALVSGGGSGHEPAHAGFVGEGLLTAAVCGELFASPSVDAVLSAIVAVTGAPGCLLIVKNYTGDRLNFGLAAEKARAMGLAVEMVVVGDDIALPDAPRPRGIAGTLFVHKLAGAAAASGLPLAEVAARARSAAGNIRSLGLSLTNCSMPGTEPNERIAEDKVELGLGIHGEPGSRTIPFAMADVLVAEVADAILAALPADGRIALMVNALGAVPPLEMAIVMQAVARSALAARIDYVVGPGPLMTALDMHGLSLSALVLDETRLEGLLAPSASAGWLAARPFARPVVVPAPALGGAHTAIPSDDPLARRAITLGTDLFREIAAEIDALDAKVGDGDTGATFAGAAATVRDKLDALPLADGARLLGAIGDLLARAAGGSSGVLLATFFTAAGSELAAHGNWPRAWVAGLQRMKDYGGADVGDRTMIDALQPALAVLESGGSLQEAARAARAGANSTATLGKAMAGRSAYVPTEALLGVTDPGAEAIARLFERLARDIGTPAVA